MSDAQKRVVFDFEIDFSNGGGLQGQGFRLDIDAGSSERWAPGETRSVSLVRFGGSGNDADDGRGP